MVNKIISFFKSLNEKQALLILIGVTFGLRLYAVLMAKGIANDSAAYGFMARDFIRGDILKGLSSPLHPFYPLLISLVSPDTAHVEIAGRLISLFFGTLTIIPIFYLSKEIVEQKGAIFSGLFYSFHPYLVTYSGMLLSEATYCSMLTLSIYFFWAGLKQNGVLRVILSAFFLALAYLTRPEGFGYLIVFLIWIMIYNGFKRGWLKKFALMGIFLSSFFILASPYILQIHRETGQWLISKKAIVVQSQLLEVVEEIGNPLKSDDAGREKTFQNPWNILTIGGNIIRYLPFTTYHYLRAYHFSLWLFLIFGLIRLREKGGKNELYLASFVFFHIISLSTFTKSTIRYSVPLISLSLFWAGAGALEIQRFMHKIRISKPERWIFCLVMLVILIQLPQSLKPERKHREEQKIVGIWLKQNTPKNSRIMSNSSQEVFYADREFVPLPQGALTSEKPENLYREIIQYAREKGVKYILTDKNTSEMIPGFMECIQPIDLKEIFKFKEKTIYGVLY